MAYMRDITAADKIFFDTDIKLRYTVYKGDPTAADIANNAVVPEDVSSWTFSWVLRKTAKDAIIQIEKTTGDGITVTGTYDSDPLMNTQRVEVQIDDEDTYEAPDIKVPAGNYEYALKRIDEGSETILAWGKFTWLIAAAWE